jgi:hypothetical protein
MLTRFVFTTRDWFWLCIVLALAFGWGVHVRYSTLLEWREKGLPIQPVSQQELDEQEALAHEHDDRYRWEEKWRKQISYERENAEMWEKVHKATDYAIKKTLSAEQIGSINQAAKEYLEEPR